MIYNHMQFSDGKDFLKFTNGEMQVITQICWTGESNSGDYFTLTFDDDDICDNNDSKYT